MKKAHSQKQYSRGFLFFLVLIIQSLQVGLYAQCSPQSGVISGIVYEDLNNNGVHENNEPAIGGTLVTIYNKSGQLITFTNSTNTGYYSFNNLTDGQPYRLTFDYLPQYSTSFLGNDNGSSVQFINAPACNASIGLVNLTTSCGDDPVVYTSCFVQGAVNGAYANEPTLIGFNYSINPSEMKSMFATHGQTGSVWGVAWKSETSELFSSAFVKQYSALTPHGHGAIFKTAINGNTGTTSLFANLGNLGVNIGTMPVTDANNCSYGHQVGKYGLGAIALNSSEEVLYAVNLYNKSLVIMPTVNPTSANTREIVIPNPNCSNGEYAPFGLKYHNDKLYISVTCTEETGGNDVNSAAVIYEYDPATNTFTNIFSTNYLKGHWSNTPENSLATQHWFTDLDFTDDGNMVIAFTDRTGHKFCNSPSNRLDHQFPDILMVWNNNGVWTLEENGKAGSLTGSGVGNGQGPANGVGQTGEFFGNDYWITQPLYHPEIALGSVYVLPGTNSVLTSAYDPVTNSYSGGFQKYSTRDGSKLGAIEIYTRQTTIQFGKATGFGDITARCGAAPIQIGNLVWFDDNKNGLQDAGEPIASNVALSLLDENCVVLQNTTTDAKGNYTFSNLEAGKLYYVALSNSIYNSQYGLVNIAGKTYSFTNSVGNNGNIDNNASTLSGCGNAVMTSQYSRTNHSLDIGLVEVSDFDLALMKEPVGSFVKFNDLAEFRITIYNQGAIPAKNVQITDYIPAGLQFVASENPGWTFANGKATTTISETLLPGSSVERNIKLKVVTSDVTKMINKAEISSATDHNGDVHVDNDSSPDTDGNNDVGGDLGTNTDDKIDDDGSIDEDDEDPAAPRVIDLALKQVVENDCVVGGQCVTINITVYNQGNTNVSSYTVTNYGHALMTFNQNLNPGWTNNNGVFTYTGTTLNKGTNQQIPLQLCVRDGVLDEQIINYAEISEMRVGSTVITSDFDSNPDNNQTNDAGGTPTTTEDNYINGVFGIEEDDHDPVNLGVKFVDLALKMTTDSRKVKEGDNVCFDIYVYNQGAQTIKEFTIADYIPKGLKLISEGWSEVNSDLFTKLIQFDNGFEPGAVFVETVCFDVQNIKDIFYIENIAEVSSAYDECDVNVSDKDIDSKADLNKTNDLGGHPQTETDNLVNGLPSLDEDDHDPAILIAYIPIIGNCSCLSNATTKDNGQFSQTLTVRAPSGMTWYIDEVVNLYSTSSPFPPAALVPFTTGPAGYILTENFVNPTTSDYVLNGIFEDGQDFTVIVKSTNDDYQLFEGGGCTYSPTEVFGLASICSSTEEQYQVDPTLGGFRVVVEGGTVATSNADSSVVNIQWSSTPGNYSVTFIDKTPRSCKEPGVLEVAVGNATTVMACKSNIQVSLDANCELLVTPAMVIAGAIQPDAPYIVMLTDDKGNPIQGNLLTKDQIGKNVMAKLIEGCGGNSCWGTLHVEDKIKPTFICNEFVEVNCYDIDGYPGPIVLDNCSDVIIVNTVDSLRELLYCNRDYTMYVFKSYQAIDKSGNKSDVCEQQIGVKRIDMDTIVFPADIEMANALTCGGYALDEFGRPSPSVTGVPTILGSPIFPNFENECNIAVGYIDRDFGYIGCTRKIMRVWTAYESWCVTGVIRQDTQTIIIADIESPEFICVDTIRSSAGHNDCEGLINLPAITGITDDCATTFTIDVAYPGGFLDNQNGGWVSLPVGEHEITYTVYDECGNTSSCTTIALIEDKTAPVMVCDQNTTVGINSNGDGYVYATSLDDGSFDACGLDYLEVRRMDAGVPCGLNQGFDETAPFCCADVNKTIIVELRGWDLAGNSNSCMVNILVQDKTIPTITCPANVTINCEVNYDLNNLSQYGVATANDACGATLTTTALDFVDQCRVGFIRRIFTANDGANIARCTSFIQIQKDPNALVITWPQDYATDNKCTELDLHPDNLPEPFNKPTFNDGVCDLVAATHEDDYFPFDDGNGSCYKILRTWTVLDWCRMNEPGYEPSYYQQILKVSNSVAPTIEIDADDEVCTLDDSCEEGDVLLGAVGDDDCTPVEDLFWSYSIDYDYDGVFVADVTDQGIGSEIDASGVYPVGEHRIIFTFEDRCGNQTSEFHDFIIKNCKAPTPSCINGTSISLNQMILDGQPIRMACISAESINASSFHVCDYPITFSFSPDINDTIKCFTCEDIGINTIYLYVTDIYGNQSFCETYIDVQNNSGGTVNITATDTEICRGESVTLTASDGLSYLWNTIPPQTTKSITVSPQVTTTYTVQVTTLDGCTLSASQEVVVNQPPTGNITGTMVICRGNSTTLTAPLGASYLWSNNATTSWITVNPVTNTVYSVTVTAANGCTAVFNTTVVVNQPPVVSITGNNIICLNQSTTLTASGGGTYLWSNNATTAAITVSPVVTTTYTVTVTSTQGCTATGSVTVTVNPLPNAAITGNNIICIGQSTTLTASGGGTYLWNTGATTTSITVSPTTTTTYTVTVTSTLGCTATATRTVTVNPLPVAAITGDNTICIGESTTLTASGGGTYLWSTGAITAAITVNPITTTTYTVTVTAAQGCTDTESIVVTVNPLPQANITGDGNICVGESTTLTASGGTSYVWNTTPPQTTASITVSPIVNTTYIVTVTNANGCTNTGLFNVVVNPLPVAVITGDQIICLGLSDTLFASGAGVNGSYLWSTGQTTSSIIVAPIVNTTYSVTVTTAAPALCTDTESFTVTVHQDNLPIAACKDVTVELDENGEFIITPALVDDGSEPGCDDAPLTFTVTPGIVFCNDVQISPITVTLIVSSTSGSDTCTSLITVNDNMDPEIICPPNLAIDCSVFTGIDSLEIATAEDNCQLPIVTTSALIDATNNCGIGTITRTFLATDASGNIDECTQIITINNTIDPLSLDDIIFPADTILTNCTSTDTSVTGQVIIENQNDNCSNISISYADTITGDPCNFTLMRTWTVIDSCQLNPLTGAGIFVDVQTIIVNDNQPPLILGYGDLLVNTFCDDSLVFDMSGISFVDCSDTITITNNSPFATDQNSGDISGNYPPGIFEIIITATDECGNTSMDSFTLTVVLEDTLQYVCIKLIERMTDALTLTFPASSHVKVVQGLCNDDILEVTYNRFDIADSLRTYDCNDLGDNNVFVYIFINGIYIDSCKTLNTIIDPDSLCTTNIFKVAGIIETENLEPVMNVNIELEGSGMSTINTNNSGSYFFPEMTSTGQYIVKPLKNDELLKGVSTLDIIIIQRHILDVARLKSPYKMIAADINNDNKISAADLVELRKAILGMSTSFKNNTSWKTISKSYSFPDPNNPLTSNYPLYQEINSNYSNSNIDFIGVKIGDVDQSYRASVNTEKNKNGISLNQVIESDNMSKTISYRLNGNQGIDGFQLVFDITDVDVEDINTSVFKENEFSYYIDGNKLIIIAAAENVINAGNNDLFTIKTSNTGRNNSVSLINDANVKNEIYTELRGKSVNIVNDNTSSEFIVDQNIPNPWTTSTAIPVTVSEEGVAKLEVLDNLGRIVYRNVYQLKAGKNMLSISSSNISAKGNFIYKLNYNGVTKHGKMIIIE